MPRTNKIILRMREAGILFAVFVLCVPSAQPQTRAAEKSATREFVDETGRMIRVPQTIQRVVSLAPSLTETIYALGLQDRLVGDTDYCDYPAEAQKKTKVGGTVNPSIEKIASLRPDLVLVTKGPNRLETVETLKALGIPSYATDPHTVDEIVSSTVKIAEIMGVAETGKIIAEDMEKHLATLHQKLGDVAARRVLFVVWTEPLISIGKDTFIADALRRAGAVSIVEAGAGWSEINLEEVAKLQPEYLVFASSNAESVARDVDVLADRPGWRLLDAVRNRRFAVISDAVNRPAPRIVSAIEDLARQLHPEVFLPDQNKESMEKRDNAGFPKKPRPFTVSRTIEPRVEGLACAL